ncbi:hypothetical protein DPMN_143514 [Dreissena polymorpha]|uniref:Uncharacterized protein n=1 Tax=Dreissena polymorpha TaxID=45954 RepID=A0A9D4GH94_DREPO|nr:hypothetical protein DPMN_143514 [Dreissena polymorpha]
MYLLQHGRKLLLELFSQLWIASKHRIGAKNLKQARVMNMYHLLNSMERKIHYFYSKDLKLIFN